MLMLLVCEIRDVLVRNSFDFFVTTHFTNIP
jgi:hypothetical protein